MKNRIYRYNFLIILLILFNMSISLSHRWHVKTVDNTGVVGDYNSITLDSKDYPHISYYDFYGENLKYAYFDGSNWHIETVDSDDSVGQFSSIDLDSKDHPHISYFDETYGNLKYAYYDGSSWNIKRFDTFGYEGEYTSINVDLFDHIHIAYFKPGTDDLKYAYYNGSLWFIRSIDTDGYVGSDCSIATDSKGYPHISYYDATNSDLKYAYFDGSDWHIESVDTEGRVGYDTSIAIDSKDHIHISYVCTIDTPKYHSAVKYAYYDGSSWHISFVGNDNYEGQGTSIAVDSKDYPHIVYEGGPSYDDTMQLRYAYYDGSKWNILTVERDFLSNYIRCSIALDSKNYPHISYFYYNERSLRYAWYGEGVYINLISFSAIPHNNSIVLNWNVSTDEDITGFNLYRKIATSTISPVREIAQSPLQPGDDYVWTKINSSLITGENPYSFEDRDILPDILYEYKLEAVTSDETEVLGTTQINSSNKPSSFSLTNIYPNPAFDKIEISFEVPIPANVDISMYDITGRRVNTIADGLYNPGEYTLTSDISCLTNGVYIMKMTTDCFSASKNFVVAR